MTAAITARNLNFSYGNSSILKNISFSIWEGEFFIIIGPNGSGKTTLLRALSGVANPQMGEIKILRKPLSSYSRRSLARIVAFVPQMAPVDFPFTVGEVVIMGRSPHMGLFGLEREKDTGLAEQAMAFTGIEHLAGRKLHQLSGGERQRVFIARAICQEPKIMLLDEPTASLDIAHQIRVMDLMEKLRDEKGITLVMVSHDINLAAIYADRLMLLKEGQIVSLGQPKDVLVFKTLEETYDCFLLVDESPLGKFPYVMPVPKKLLNSVNRDKWAAPTPND